MPKTPSRKRSGWRRQPYSDQRQSSLATSSNVLSRSTVELGDPGSTNGIRQYLPFSDFPSEIRNMVYQYVYAAMVQDFSPLMSPEYIARSFPVLPKGRQPTPPLLLVSHQVKEEFSAIISRRRVICIYKPVLKSLEEIAWRPQRPGLNIFENMFLNNDHKGGATKIRALSFDLSVYPFIQSISWYSSYACRHWICTDRLEKATRFLMLRHSALKSLERVELTCHLPARESRPFIEVGQEDTFTQRPTPSDQSIRLALEAKCARVVKHRRGMCGGWTLCTRVDCADYKLKEPQPSYGGGLPTRPYSMMFSVRVIMTKPKSEFFPETIEQFIQRGREQGLIGG